MRDDFTIIGMFFEVDMMECLQKKLKKFLPYRFVELVLASLCLGTWGCSDNVSFDWGKYRSDESVAGFINDSLVIVTDCRHWHEITEGWNGSYSEETSCGHDRMLIYNYRVQEEGPRWTDSLTNKSNGGYWKQLTDSIIWQWNEEKQEKLIIWKIGQKSKELKPNKVCKNCLGDFEVNRMHQWLDGTFIAWERGKLSVGGDSCQYAVLDTVAETIIYKRFDEKLKWIEDCDDVMALDGDVYCLALDAKNGNSFLVKNNVNDTIPAPRKFAIGGFWGNMIKLSGNICSLVENEITCSDVIWYGGELKFYRNDELIVEY